MKKFKNRLKKLAVFLMILVMFTGAGNVKEYSKGGISEVRSKAPVKILYAAEKEDEDEEAEQDEEDKNGEDNEAAEDEDTDSDEQDSEADADSSPRKKSEAVFSIQSTKEGVPVLTLTPEKSETEKIDFQILKASYEDFDGYRVKEISWGINAPSKEWLDAGNSENLKFNVTTNAVIYAQVKTENDTYIITASYRVRNVDTLAPEFQRYSSGKLYEQTLLGDVANSKAKSVKVNFQAVDSGLGLADKAYACTSDRDAFVAINRAGRNSTAEQLAAVDWQETGEFIIDEKGVYYILVRDTVNNVEFTTYEADCIDNEPPETEITEEYNEVEGYISENRLIATSNDRDGVGLAELPYSWNLGERTDDNTITVKENGKVTLDVYDALMNKEHTEINIEDYKFDTEGPVIRSVKANPGETYNSYAGNVWIKVEAEDEKISIADNGYSFDGGVSWQSQSVKNVTANGKFNICVRDSLMNVTRGEEISVKNIDDEKPEIDSAVYTLQGVKSGYAKSALITVEAEDGKSGLSSNAYSFDGGGTYQLSNTYTVDKNGVYDICVQDAFHNTAKRSVTISGIDCTAPEITVTGNPTAAVYKAVTLNVSASDSESGIVSIWYKNDSVNVPSAIYQISDTAGRAAANCEAVINVNGDYTFYAYDALGNVAKTQVSVTKITKKKTQNTDSDSGSSSSGSSSSSSSEAAKTIVLPPTTGSVVTSSVPVAKTSSYTAEETEEAVSGKTIVLKGSASANSEGSDEDLKKENKKGGDFELEFEEAVEGESGDELPDKEETPTIYEGGIISIEDSEHDSEINEASPQTDAETGEISEKLLKSASQAEDKKGNAGVIVLIVASVVVIAAGGVTLGILVKRGVIKIPDFFDEKE